MTNSVLIKSGTYRNQTFENQVFSVLAPLKTGANGLFITVDGAPANKPGNKIRVKVSAASDVVSLNASNEITEQIIAESVITETDEEIMDRMRRKFQILDDMTLAACQGVVRGMVVTGPAGVGKSFGVDSILNEARAMAKMGGKTQVKIDVEKGSASPIGLFMLLYEYAAKGSVLVLDDADSILYDEISCNMLKAALDGGKKRRLSWRSESRALESRGVPDTFNFEGSIIFITNLDFSKSRGKIAEHLKAIMSRCHYLDMEIGNTREKFLRCKQIVADGMLNSYNLSTTEEHEILDYIESKKDVLRELSLRTVLKVADLRCMNAHSWKDYADATVCKRH